MDYKDAYVLKLESGKHWGLSLDKNTIFVGRGISERKGRSQGRERRETGTRAESRMFCIQPRKRGNKTWFESGDRRRSRKVEGSGLKKGG